MSRTSCWATVIVLLLSLVGAERSEAALDAAQKQTLANAEKVLKQVEINLKLAQDAAGPGTAAIEGAKARLAQTRLANAKAPAEQVAELLAALPGDDPQVAALQKRFAAVQAGIAALDARLSGKPAGDDPKQPDKTPPDKNPPTKTPAAAGEAKLDYKQEQLAKDARSYLAEIEGLAGGAADVVKQIAAAKDQSQVDFRLVQSGANAITKARQRAALVKGRLDQLPANGKGVAELAAQHKSLLAALDTADKVLGPLHKKLGALIDPTAYPELEADIKRLQELALMYQRHDGLAGNVQRAATLVEQAAAAQAEAARIAKAYTPLVQQKTPEGERLEKMSQFFKESITAFTAVSAKRKQALPAEIEADLAKAARMADTAVAEQKPAFFQGGIPQIVGQAEGKLTLLAVLDADRAAAAKTAVDKAKQTLTARAASLKDVIIASNELPPDRYAGSDKRQLEKLAADAWKTSEPKAEVLAIRIPSEQWNREKLLRRENGAWRLIDRSQLQAQLLVKHDGKLAVIRPINLWIDHVNGDKLTAIPLDDAKDSLPPQRYLPIEKVK